MMIFFRNPLALSGLIIIITILFLAIFAPLIAPYDPNYIDIDSILVAPNTNHIMGTDGLGRDVRKGAGRRSTTLCSLKVRINEQGSDIPAGPRELLQFGFNQHFGNT